ncbi:MAG: ferrous iron transport protein B [Campylobacteraceae bacterium]|nr:ferrous iron transport protein B [Campylobacteraceae bacterium]
MKKIVIALVGQPNVGKSHLANALSGSNLKIGNFAGVTVEKAIASFSKDDTEIEIIDLPGLYSLEDFSADEKVTKDFLLKGEYDLILNVIDSTNLERNLNLSVELMELDKKMIIALNMDDEAHKEGIEIDATYMRKILSIPCIKVSSKTKYNIDALQESILHVNAHEPVAAKLFYSDIIETELEKITSFLDEKHFKAPNMSNRHIAIGLLWQRKPMYAMMHEQPLFIELQPILNNALGHVYMYAGSEDIEEVINKENAAFVSGLTTDVMSVKAQKSKNLTQAIDKLLIHKLLGIPIFVFLMWGLFQLTFTLGQAPMDWIEGAFQWLGEIVGATIENEAIKSLIVDGIIVGVGSVLMFLPNIMILFLGISLLETTGYMSRVAFLLDGFFHKFGLHGKSFIPLVTGFGCSVPAYMAARTLKNKKDRLLTMFIIGFMSCGARLPVFVLFAGAFFDEDMAGNVLFIIYISGALLGLIAGKILSVTAFKGEDEPFVMEMPKYRFPSPRLIWFSVYSKSIMYLKKAGTFILMASMLIWFISSYPKNSFIEESYAPQIEAALDEEKGALENEMREKMMENTYLGIIGKTIEPIFTPLGFDWKMSVATISGLAAKEVIVSTLGVLYSLGDEVSEDDASLKEIISKSISFPSAIAFIIFVMIYLPCIAATAVFAKEAENYKYTIYLVVFTFATAWIFAFIAYQTLSLFY